MCLCYFRESLCTKLSKNLFFFSESGSVLANKNSTEPTWNISVLCVFITNFLSTVMRFESTVCIVLVLLFYFGQKMNKKNLIVLSFFGLNQCFCFFVFLEKLCFPKLFWPFFSEQRNCSWANSCFHVFFTTSWTLYSRMTVFL